MEKPSHFVIVGGGTAGWLAAFILQDTAKRQKLNARFSVVESSKIPTVGVGESTTAVFRIFLKHFDLDEFAFLRETRATIKLGIRHQDWRQKGHSYFGPIDDPHQVIAAPKGAPSDYLNVFSVAAGRPVQDMHLFEHLFQANKAPYAQKPDGSLIALGPFHYAYQFDQARVGQYLKRQSKGIEIIDATVAEVARDPVTGDIISLEMEDGQSLAGDFFIDATGFRKRLILKEMQANWLSFGDALPVNRALPFWLPIPEGEAIPNHTLAWAQNNGWMWKIPTQERYGCGYVFSDQFISADEAKAEIEQSLGHEIDVRNDIKLDAGRLENAWIGNCVAVGLSSSFLEPLESTSIHGTIVQMMLFAEHFLRDPSAMTSNHRADYNARIARQVDDFRSFVSLHYMTERDDTPFWRDVTENRIHGETRERLEYWKHSMPRHEHFPAFLGGLPHVESQLHYPVLDGLGLLDAGLARQEMAQTPKLRSFARQTVDSLTREYRAAANVALPHAKFYELINAME
ncbi:tryptophan 7-halogenase [Devosia rhodophyticola]|uniref:Tryptophan 7-halogenase n=1 Tax=Devosia rhodophyticola TaxID=3026423 RepID=A0ABY7YV46_9HYPH|nr:tryptophan halogenase family protein [Devosia rhodophyticola]WDR04978.1 tryptophan 7-halogenase [Devosia rhodophyticola]